MVNVSDEFDDLVLYILNTFFCIYNRKNNVFRVISSAIETHFPKKYTKLKNKPLLSSETMKA